jgi:hypothetical protein
MPGADEILQNSRKAREKAQQLFPQEIWRETEERIFIAEM